jgi:hypothetical protein
VTAVENPAEVNADFNLSTAQSRPVPGLAQAIWLNLKKGLPLSVVHDAPFNTTSRRVCLMWTRRVTSSSSKPPHSTTSLTSYPRGLTGSSPMACSERWSTRWR